MDGRERLLALDEETGAVLWSQSWPATYRNIHWKFANGPRTPPTVEGNRVYVLGAAGMLSCLDAEVGDVVWQVDTLAEYGASVPVYGVSHAPLVEGELLTKYPSTPIRMRRSREYVARVPPNVSRDEMAHREPTPWQLTNPMAAQLPYGRCSTYGSCWM